MMNSKQVILKHDQLQNLSSRFESIDEQRFLNSCLIDVYQRDLLDRESYYPVDINNYASKQNISLGKAYQELKQFAERFTESLKIELPTGETWVTRLIYSYKYDDSNISLSIRFNEEIIPYISGDMPKGEFCTYNARLDTVPSNRRYLMGELIQRNLYKLSKEGKFILSIPSIRYALNLKEGEYKVYSGLYQRVIKETLVDLAELSNIYLSVSKRSIGVIFTKVSKEEFYAK